MIVDAANVVGSRPDGWWRDRIGANARLRDALAVTARRGLAGLAPPLEIVLVVEGRARGLASIAEVRVVAAAGSADDAIVELVRARAADRPCVVVTADRELGDRVRRAGALVRGPRSIPRPPSGQDSPEWTR